jgi:hypothetical protein
LCYRKLIKICYVWLFNLIYIWHFNFVIQCFLALSIFFCIDYLNT